MSPEVIVVLTSVGSMISSVSVPSPVPKTVVYKVPPEEIVVVTVCGDCEVEVLKNEEVKVEKSLLRDRRVKDGLAVDVLLVEAERSSREDVLPRKEALSCEKVLSCEEVLENEDRVSKEEILRIEEVFSMERMPVVDSQEEELDADAVMVDIVEKSTAVLDDDVRLLECMRGDFGEKELTKTESTCSCSKSRS